MFIGIGAHDFQLLYYVKHCINYFKNLSYWGKINTSFISSLITKISLRNTFYFIQIVCNFNFLCVDFNNILRKQFTWGQYTF